MTRTENLINEEEENKFQSSSFSIILEKQEVVQLTTVPRATPDDALLWESADEEIATVTNIGRITAIDIGETQIHVKNTSLTFEDYIYVEVVNEGEAEQLRLAVSLRANEIVRLKLRIGENPIWKSLDNSVAVVSATGEVTGISEGMALITATYGEEVKVIYVMVHGRPVNDDNLADYARYERIKDVVLSNNEKPSLITRYSIGSLGAGTNKWTGGVLAPNGKIYGIPQSDQTVLEIDPETNATTTFGDVGTGTNKWAGGVLANNGKIYGIPRSSINILEIDPDSRRVNLLGNTGSATNKWFGGIVAPNGKIYGIPFNESRVMEFDPETKEVNLFGNVGSNSNKWVGGVLSSNGKIYGIPYNSAQILEIDPVNRTATTFGDVGTDTAKWYGGVLSANGKIYGIPCNSRSVLEIDTVDKTTRTFGSVGTGTNKWTGGVLGPNGNIYGVTASATAILEINPETSTTTTVITQEANTLKWEGGTIGLDGKVYFIPRNSSIVQVISLGDELNRFDTESITSSWINKL